MSVWLDKQRKTYRYDFQRNGQRYAGICIHPDNRTHARTLTEAKKIEAILIVRANTGIVEKEPPLKAATASTFTLAQCLCDYLEEAKKTDRSWWRAPAIIDHILRFFGRDATLSSISQKTIENYGRFLSSELIRIYKGGPRKGGEFQPDSKSRVRDVATRNRYLGVLRKGWREAERRYRAELPGFPLPPQIKSFKVPKTNPNPIRQQDVVRILNAAPMHLQEVIVLTLNIGGRVSEILKAVVKEVDWENAKIIFPAERTKGHKERIVDLNEIAMALLWRLRNRLPDPNDGDARLIRYQRSPDSKPMPINSIRTAWKNTLRRAGIPGKYKFHGTRGAFITYLAANGVPGPVIQRVVGHEDPRTTARYIAIEDKYAKQAVRKLKKHPAFVGAKRGTDILSGIGLKEPASTRQPLAEPTPYIGVYPKRGKRVYEAKITVVEDGRKRIRYIGTFPTPEEAARARDVVAKQIGGRKLNFPDPAPQAPQAATTDAAGCDAVHHDAKKRRHGPR
jgi:integrase